eukprot:TRINITY_DN63724_c0_g1_i1.p1 TRINITY_DN63724_c0_g1~~TRINITY_DN63724_c0_g1_i1.p1  ORF type:complete len:294 (+),score=46.15 TRINITY_DN63724_c0_g1_i1:41-883(+)
MVEVSVESLLDRLYMDDETKDVRIEMADGILWAHSNILGAASDAMKGVLRHVAVAQEKALSWREHSTEVGRFFLRLLYTGAVLETDWQHDAQDVEIPLRLLLGSLSLAKVFQVPHLLKPLTDVLKLRLDPCNFDKICTHAIDLDVTELRRACLQYAEKWGRLCLGTIVRTETQLTEMSNKDAANVPNGTMGEVVKEESDGEDDEYDYDDESKNLFVKWDNDQGNDFDTALHLLRLGMITVVSGSVYNSYLHGELSPQVNFELAALWGVPTAGAPKRKTLR